MTVRIESLKKSGNINDGKLNFIVIIYLNLEEVINILRII